MGRARALLPNRGDWTGQTRRWRADLIAGLTVAVVALPLALGFGVASGLGAQAGLATAVVAGALAAVFGGSGVQVSGPTGAMTVVLVPIMAAHGADGVLTVGLLAGGILLVLAVLGAGRLLAWIPVPVIEGFTIGIALVIGIQQVPAALGVRADAGEEPIPAALHAVVEFGRSPGASGAVAVAVALAVLVAARLRPSLPAAILAVAAATVIVAATGLPVSRVGSLPAGLPLPSVDFVHADALPHLIVPAVTVALLCAVESLLSASVADVGAGESGLDPDRELFGQGVANLAAPLVGGVPATGAIARTAVNVRAGGRTRLAALSHAVILAAVVWTAAPLAAQIPIPALAGVLLATAVRMVDREAVCSVLRARRSDAAVLWITVAGTVVLDLIRAVVIGVAVAAVIAVRDLVRAARARRASPQAAVEALEPDPPASLPVVHLDRPVLFTTSTRSLRTITSVEDTSAVVVRMCRVGAVDVTGARALADAIRHLERRGVAVFVSGIRNEHRRVLDAQRAVDGPRSAGRVFPSASAAVHAARAHVATGTGP